jgi:hypothetical protein
MARHLRPRYGIRNHNSVPGCPLSIRFADADDKQGDGRGDFQLPAPVSVDLDLSCLG